MTLLRSSSDPGLYIDPAPVGGPGELRDWCMDSFMRVLQVSTQPRVQMITFGRLESAADLVKVIDGQMVWAAAGVVTPTAVEGLYFRLGGQWWKVNLTLA